MNTINIYNNPFIQYGAAILLFTAIIGTMGLFAFQTVTGRPISGWEQTFLVTALTLSANVLGYHQGAVNATDTSTSTIKAVSNGTVSKPV